MHTTENRQWLTGKILAPGIRLAVFIGIMVFAVSLVHLLTRDAIAIESKNAAEVLLYEIAGPDTTELVQLSPDHYQTTDADDHKGHIIKASTRQGYNGDISLWVGTNHRGEITGVRIIAHRETPGLGDQISLDVSDWVLGFNGKSLSNPAAQYWQVKKDGGQFDQFTGATITPRAIVSAVHDTLLQLNSSTTPLNLQGDQ
jgi:electron transport complex protein RnfG